MLHRPRPHQTVMTGLPSFSNQSNGSRDTIYSIQMGSKEARGANTWAERTEGKFAQVDVVTLEKPESAERC